LNIVSEIDLEHFEGSEPDCPMEEYAAAYPFSSSADEAPDLTRVVERHYTDSDHGLDMWAKRFVLTDGPIYTLAMLAAITQSIKNEFQYAARYGEGVQTPTQTLRLKSGTCRDFGAAHDRSCAVLGFAARFVSGYLYAPAADNGTAIGGGATHAWVQIYQPRAGWMEFDPTNGIVGNRDLIRVAVTRDPVQAIPIKGNWTGALADFLGLTVEVNVTSL
jgi:transglutaminase-like putative cysteine protease